MKNGVFWFTGLPSSGKTTLGVALQEYLLVKGIRAVILDGDRLRSGLCKDLGFSTDDRIENIRRAAELSKVIAESGVWVICCFVSPMQSMRDMARSILHPYPFYEIYLDCPIEVCVKRDVKGLFHRAKEGTVQNLTGIDAPYEVPSHPDFIVDTGCCKLNYSTSLLCDWAGSIAL